MNEQSDALTPDELIGSLRSLANDLRYEGDEQRSEWLRRCADSATAMRGLLKSANVIIGVNAEIEALAADELEAICNENDDLRDALEDAVGKLEALLTLTGCPGEFIERQTAQARTALNRAGN